MTMRTLFSLLLLAGCLSAGNLSGRRAPGFSLQDLQFKQHDPQDYRGRILLIDIMQTSCPHCQTFVQVLEEVSRKYAGKVAVLSIVNPPDSLQTVSQFLARTKSTIPILFDCGQVAASYLQVTPKNPQVTIPHLFIIDTQGIVRNDYAYGPLTRDIFEGRALFNELDRMIGAATKK